ncbi:MAG TPA: putative Ig domain-containing protein [Chitinophagaceae bacterium]|nr:putative Ig domain-containing protein [Chitinophagaceae bacterium]
MSNTIKYLFVLLAGAAASAGAQTKSSGSFWNSPQAYLGQTPPGDTPVKFAPLLINNDSFFSMDRCAFSADGKEFYYDQNNTWFSSKDASIQVLKFDGAKWVGPAMFVKRLYAPSFTQNDDTVYLIGAGRGRVMQMHRTATGWSKPDTAIKRSYGLYDFMITTSGNIYASSNINGPANNYSFYDVCMAKPLASGDTTITTLGKPMNTPGFDGDFFVAPDESYILISAKEKPDYECEIFISYHRPDGTWTNPKTLGALINYGEAHRWGEYVTPNNKYLFYSYGHGPEDCSLYWVRFDNLLEKLKHTNFEPYVKDSIPMQKAAVNKSFNFTLPANTFYDDDGNNTLTYMATTSFDGPLPAWLQLKGQTLTGTPPRKGDFDITIKAIDNAKATAACTFTLRVE